jgi:DNA gyrase subunit A
MQSFKLTEVQAVAILDLQLRRLAALERKKIEDELRDVLKEIARLEDLLNSPRKILALIKEDLRSLKEKFGDERRSRIIDAVGDISDEDLIPRVDVLVTLTNRGYVKRLANDTYRTQRRGGRGVTGVTMRDADGVQHLVAANSHDSVLFFTDRGRVYQLRVFEVPDASRTARGMPIINLISLQPDESITTLLPVTDFDDGQWLFMCTRNGTVKRTALSQFASVRSSGLIAITLDDDDELAWVRPTSGDDDIIIVTEKAKAIRFAESDVRAMGRPAAGVIGIRMDTGDRVMAVDVIDAERTESDLLTVSDNGFGKRTILTEFSRQHRGGQGVTAMKLTAKNGTVAGAHIVEPEHELMLMSSSGVVIRMPVAQISRYGRATQGVSVMKLGAGDRVASLTVLAERSDEADNLQEALMDLSEPVSPAPKAKNGRTAKAARGR